MYEVFNFNGYKVLKKRKKEKRNERSKKNLGVNMVFRK